MDAPDRAFVAVDWNGTVVPFFGRPAHPGALAVLARVRARGLPLFVVSRAPQSVIAADVARIGLTCDGVIGCLDKGPVLSELRAQHGPGILLGDTSADRRAAQEAGVSFLQARLEGEEPLSGAESFTAWSEVGAHLLADLGEQG